MTMASSTTMPMARMRANRVIRLTVKPSRAMAAKAPMMVHRHGGGRNQHGPPILQEHHDDDKHQDAGLKQGDIDRVNGLADKLGGVVMDGVFQALRKVWLISAMALAPLAPTSMALAPGRAKTMI